MSKEYSSKQIEKYKRQKYISALNKCTKNLYKIFKDNSTTYEYFKSKFMALIDELNNLEEVRLNTHHSKKTKEYIEELYNSTINNKSFGESDFLDIKSIEITKLNRLQKLKNRTKYARTKYKNNPLED